MTQTTLNAHTHTQVATSHKHIPKKLCLSGENPESQREKLKSDPYSETVSHRNSRFIVSDLKQYQQVLPPWDGGDGRPEQRTPRRRTT